MLIVVCLVYMIFKPILVLRLYLEENIKYEVQKTYTKYDGIGCARI